jgi:hypothetical protein
VLKHVEARVASNGHKWLVLIERLGTSGLDRVVTSRCPTRLQDDHAAAEGVEEVGLGLDPTCSGTQACFGFRVSGFGFRVSGFGFRVSSFGFRVSCVGCRVPSAGCGVSDAVCQVAGTWCREGDIVSGK